jgi:hypothetical protein
MKKQIYLITLVLALTMCTYIRASGIHFVGDGDDGDFGKPFVPPPMPKKKPPTPKPKPQAPKPKPVAAGPAKHSPPPAAAKKAPKKAAPA